MFKYQLRFCDSKGNGHFEYVEVKSKEEALQKAAEKATEELNKPSRHSIFSAPQRPKRVIHVWEMDMETKQPKKKGHRFKLELYYFEVTYDSGRKVRNEWYEPIEIKEPSKK